jgi:cysteine desulfurase
MPLEGLGRCAYVTACAHKFGGPKGVGFALLPEGASEVGLFSGGPQEGGRRAGTEDVPGILAMLAALEAAPGVASALEPQRFKARDQFIDGIQRRLPGTEVLGLGAERLWNTVALLPTAFASTRWISALEKRGFRVSSGSACASGSSDQSHVLEAMGVDAVSARRVLRISSGAATKDADWQALEDALVEVSEALGAESDASASTVISID